MAAKKATAYLAARVVVVVLPDSGYKNGVLLPVEDFADILLRRWPNLQGVEGPLVNGTIALTWKAIGESETALALHSAAIITELLESA